MNSSEPVRPKGRTPLILFFFLGGALLLFGAIGMILVPLFTQGALGASSAPPSALPVAANKPMPDLALTDIDGNTVSIADYRGQVVLINNWATWCPPCVDEMPVLDAYYQKHRNQKFVIIGIEAGDTKEVVADFVRQNKVTFPIWLDLNQKAYDVFQNPALPSSYVVDRNGVIRLSWVGAIDRKTLEKYLTPLLEE